MDTCTVARSVRAMAMVMNIVMIMKQDIVTLMTHIITITTMKVYNREFTQ